MTALQELLNFLHLDKEHEEINEHLQVHDIVLKCQDLLKKEKQQIVDAFKSGEVGIYIDGKDYYE